jgi:hypothetical protein
LDRPLWPADRPGQALAVEALLTGAAWPEALGVARERLALQRLSAS